MGSEAAVLGSKGKNSEISDKNLGSVNRDLRTTQRFNLHGLAEGVLEYLTVVMFCIATMPL
jgi:hypothetical protein